MHRVEPPALDPVPDRSPAQAQLDELRATHDPVLAISELRHRHIRMPMMSRRRLWHTTRV